MVKISGEEKTIKSETISELLTELKIDTSNIAVVINGSIIPKIKWNTEKITDSDEIEFFSPVGGG